MGCDIHLYVERRTDSGWESVPPPPDAKYGEHWGDRNYDVFAILADVRNGRGFAGCDTGDGFVPIAAPRGLPPDASVEVRKESKRWGEDGHSHSWFTIAELLAYDWSQTTKHRAWVIGDVYCRWWMQQNKQGPIYPCCGGVSGAGVKHVSNAEMERLIGEDRTGLDRTYTQIEWSSTYEDSAKSFLAWVHGRPKEYGDPDAVRIVFWFDN